MSKIGKIKIFTSFVEEEQEKWRIMASRSVDERMRVLCELQRISYPDAFDSITGKPKPMEKRLIIKTPQVFSK